MVLLKFLPFPAARAAACAGAFQCRVTSTQRAILRPAAKLPTIRPTVGIAGQPLHPADKNQEQNTGYTKNIIMKPNPIYA